MNYLIRNDSDPAKLHVCKDACKLCQLRQIVACYSDALQYVDVCLADCKFTSIEWLTMTNRKTQFLYSVSCNSPRQLSNRITLCCHTHRTQFDFQHISYSWFIWEYLQVVSLEFVSFRVISAYTHDKATAMQAISIILSVSAARHRSSLCNHKNHKRNKALIEVANPSTC